MADIVTSLGLDDRGFRQGLASAERAERGWRRESMAQWTGHQRALGDLYRSVGIEAGRAYELAEANSKRATTTVERFGRAARSAGQRVGQAFMSASTLSIASAASVGIATTSVAAYAEKWKSTTGEMRRAREEAERLYQSLGRDLSGLFSGSAGGVRGAGGLREGAATFVARLIQASGAEGTATGFIGRSIFGVGDGAIDEKDALVRQLEGQEFFGARTAAEARQRLLDRAAGSFATGDATAARQAQADLAYQDALREIGQNPLLSPSAQQEARANAAARRDGELRQIELERATRVNQALSPLGDVELELARQGDDPFRVRELEARRRFEAAGRAASGNRELTGDQRGQLMGAADEVYRATLQRIELDRQAAAERETQQRAEAERRRREGQERVEREMRLLGIEEMRASGQREEADRQRVLLDFAERRARIEADVTDESTRRRLLGELAGFERSALSRAGQAGGGARPFVMRGFGIAGGADLSIARQSFGPSAGGFGLGMSGEQDEKRWRSEVRVSLGRIVRAAERLASGGGRAAYG